MHKPRTCDYSFALSYDVSAVLTKITAEQNILALSYHRMRGLYFQAVVFEATIEFLSLECM